MARDGVPPSPVKSPYPFVLVSPRAPSSRRGWGPAALNALIDDVIANHRIDGQRIYVTGLSMGGYGTWALAQDYPDKFAAIVPICGGGDPTKAESIRSLPIWAFHGDEDSAVPFTRSEEMIAALQATGSEQSKLTVYPGVGHDSWTETYSNPELWE